MDDIELVSGNDRRTAQRSTQVGILGIKLDQGTLMRESLEDISPRVTQVRSSPRQPATVARQNVIQAPDVQSTARGTKSTRSQFASKFE